MATIRAVRIECASARQPRGADPNAPYHSEHVFAEIVERMLALELGVNWERYTAAVREL